MEVLGVIYHAMQKQRHLTADQLALGALEMSFGPGGILQTTLATTKPVPPESLSQDNVGHPSVVPYWNGGHS